jgi:glutaminyl-tRNA synthetase
VDAEVRMYDRLFSIQNPNRVEEDKSFTDYINPDSLTVLSICKLEPGLADVKPGTQYQFERKGFFCADPDTKSGSPVFNLTVSLRDSWAKIENKQDG